MSSTPTPPEYVYGGARAMVALHDTEMRRFLEVWKRARAADLPLGETKDRDYASLEHLLIHVLACAAGYMRWMCEVLELEVPDMPKPPEPEEAAAVADEYLERALALWRDPLAGVEEERFYRPEHASRWKTLYCVDSMLEHAVMHPIRHRYQLEQMLG